MPKRFLLRLLGCTLLVAPLSRAQFPAQEANSTGNPAVIYAAGLPMVSSDARNRPRVAVDSAGAAFVSGFEVDLIATPSGQSGFVERAWLNKLSPQGDALVYRRTLLGARGTAVAVDSLGNAYFAGIFGIGGLDADYTPTAGALNQPGGPGFLMKLSPGGELLYAARLAAAPVGRLTPIGLMFSQLCR